MNIYQAFILFFNYLLYNHGLVAILRNLKKVISVLQTSKLLMARWTPEVLLSIGDALSDPQLSP
jgi:hypothetical protein